MKVLFRKWETEELEVEIRYSERDEYVCELENFIAVFDEYLIGELDRYQHKIPLRHIYYLESVDKKLFFYTEQQVYQMQERLIQLEQQLINNGFVRVSKSCLLNVRHLKQIRSLSNSRMEGVLANQEKIIVSRRYLKHVRQALEQKGRNR